MAKDPVERYATAQELADDLRRFLDDKPIRARRPTLRQRLRHWGRRHRPAVVAAMSAAAVVLGITLLGLALSNRAITRERDRARWAEQDRTRQLYHALFNQAQAGRWGGQVNARADALRALVEASGLAPGLGFGPDQTLRLRNEVIACLALPDARVERQWEGQPPGTRTVAFDAELRRYARCDAQGNVSVRRVADDHEEVVLERGAWTTGITRMQFSPDGQHLAVWVCSHQAHSVSLWDLGRGRLCWRERGPMWADFHPRGRRVAVIDADGLVRLLDVATGREELRFASGFPHGSSPGICFDPHGRLLAIYAGSGREVEVWPLAAPDRPRKFSVPDEIGTVGWHPHGGQLVVTAGTGILLWDLRDDRPRVTLTGHHARVVGLAFAPDAGLLASTSYDGMVRLWDPRSGRQLLSTPGALGPWFSRDGRDLAFSNGSKLVLLRVGRPEGVRTLYRARGSGIAGLDFSPDGRLLAAGGNDGVSVLDPASGAEVALLSVGRTGAAWFAPDGTSLIAGGPGFPFHWPVAAPPGPEAAWRFGPPQPIPWPTPDPPRDFALSRDGRTLVAQVGGEILALDWPGGAVRWRLRAQDNPWGPAVSPDGRWAAAGCWHGHETRVWDATTGREVCRLEYKDISASRVAFSPDGRWLVAGTGTEYQVVDTATWRVVRTIPRDNGWGLPGSIAFTPDGRLLAVAHTPETVRLYRSDTAEEVATLVSPDPHLIGGLAFSRDGAWLAASTEGNRLFVWDLRVIRGRLAALGLDWDPPASPPADAARGEGPARGAADLGELHLARRRVAHCRRVLQTHPDDPQACNGLAWHLVAGPDDLRDPEAALPLAEKAVRLAPMQAYLNTLGVVYYRLGRWADAIAALDRSVAATPGEATAFDTFFLALCYHRLGEPEMARTEYARAVRWMELYQPDDEELRRFRAEADDLLDR
jgi:WD40 repeat protein